MVCQGKSPWTPGWGSGLIVGGNVGIRVEMSLEQNEEVSESHLDQLCLRRRKMSSFNELEHGCWDYLFGVSLIWGPDGEVRLGEAEHWRIVKDEGQRQKEFSELRVFLWPSWEGHTTSWSQKL